MEYIIILIGKDMNIKNTILFVFLILLLFSCSKGYDSKGYDDEIFTEKQMEMNENSHYIVYKYKLHKSYWKYYGKYNVFYLSTDYGLRMDADLNGNLKNIYLYNGKNGIKYKMKNLNELEKIINNNFPSDIIIHYYQFCTSGSGVKNDYEILCNIKNILLNKNIKFAFSEYRYWSEYYDPDLELIWMDTCMGG